jgi:hypothetical protein
VKTRFRNFDFKCNLYLYTADLAEEQEGLDSLAPLPAEKAVFDDLDEDFMDAILEEDS